MSSSISSNSEGRSVQPTQTDLSQESVDQRDDNNGEENESGFIGGIKGKVSETLEQFLSIPDRPKKKWQQIALRIIFGLGFFMVLFLIVSTTIGGTNPMHIFSVQNFQNILAGFSNMQISTMMAVPALLGGAGLVLSWLIKDCLPNRAHRMLGKIMAVATPLLLGVAAVCLIFAGGQHSGTFSGDAFAYSQAASTSYYAAGILLIPLVIVAAIRAGRVCSSDDHRPLFIEGPLSEAEKGSEGSAGSSRKGKKLVGKQKERLSLKERLLRRCPCRARRGRTRYTTRAPLL